MKTFISRMLQIFFIFKLISFISRMLQHQAPKRWRRGPRALVSACPARPEIGRWKQKLIKPGLGWKIIMLVWELLDIWLPHFHCIDCEFGIIWWSSAPRSNHIQLEPTGTDSLMVKRQNQYHLFFCKYFVQMFRPRIYPCRPSLVPRSYLLHQLRAEGLLQHSELKNYRVAIKTTLV